VYVIVTACTVVMVQRSRDDDVLTEDVPQTSSLASRNLVVLFISLLLDLVAFTVILPLLPSLLDYYGSHDDEVLHVTACWPCLSCQLFTV